MRSILVHVCLLAATVVAALMVVDRADLGLSPAAVALVALLVAHALIEVVRWADTPDARLPAHATMQYGEQPVDEGSPGEGLVGDRSVTASERVTPTQLLGVTILVCAAMTVVWLVPFDAWWWGVVAYVPSLALVGLLFNVPLTLWFRRPRGTGAGGRAAAR